MREQIISLMEEVLQLPPGSVTEETRMEDTPEWDSLAHVMLIGELEERLGIVIPLEEAVEMESVAELLKYAAQ